MKASVILIDPQYVCIDESLRMSPVDALAGGLPPLLDRLSRVIGESATLLITEYAARALQLPHHCADLADDPDAPSRVDHPAAVALRAAGWTCRGIGRWTTIWRPGTLYRMCILPLVDNPCDNAPWACWWPEDDRAAGVPWGAWSNDMTGTLAAWRRLTGSAWTGSPGQAGNQLLIDLCERKAAGSKERTPTWRPGRGKPDKAVWPDGDPIEWVNDWRNPEPAMWRYQHTYDKRRAYLSALSCAEVARWTLRHTGRRTFDPRMGGWWKIEAAPWVIREFPNPMGPYCDSPKGVVRWVTTPTVKLLLELSERGLYGGCTIIDSWTSFGTRSVLRPFAEVLTKVWDIARRDVPDDYDRARLRAMVKGAYRQAYGMWRSERSAIYRPDWSATVIATSRTNEWRRFFRYWEQTGIAPIAWDTDAITYGSDEPDAALNPPAGIKLTEALGGYRSSTYEVGK